MARPHSDEPEVHAFQPQTEGSVCEPTVERLRPAVHTTGQQTAVGCVESAAAPAAQLTAAALQQRPAKMFVAGSGAVLESGEGAAVEKATNALVKLAFEVIENI